MDKFGAQESTPDDVMEVMEANVLNYLLQKEKPTHKLKTETVVLDEEDEEDMKKEVEFVE